MRWIFLTVIVLLFELFTYGAGRGLQWWAGSWLSERYSRYLMISLFVISNALLVFGIARLTSFGLKLSMTWLTILWFVIMSMAAVGIINMLLMKVAPQFFNAVSYQIYGQRILLPLVFFGMVLMGIYNAYTPTIRHITLTANQPLAKPIRIGMVSDLHLGLMVGERQINRLTDMVKAQNVQLLLMPGDIMDDNVDYYTSQNMQPALQQLASAVPMGAYATLGNHDMYGHEGEIRDAIKKANITLLADDKVLVDNQLWLVGRLDNHASYRKATKELMPSSTDKPIILLDHQPNEIEQNVQLPIDLQVSGHTHNGQIFPANFIVKFINRLGYGYERINNTDVIVSSGYGFWGVPFRLGSQAEFWVIDLVGKKS